MNKNAYNKLLLTAKSIYKKTAEICMKTAADEVRCLVAEEKHGTVSENSNITTIENCSDGTDSCSLQNNVVNDKFIVDTVVSGDGTWQKRGYDSLNGIVTVMQNDLGKCVDFCVLSKKCTACASCEKQQGTIEYEKFISEHDCLVNHSGSAGSMEAIGVAECFQSSAKDRKLRYTQLIGDGDSKTYPLILAADPYLGITVEKLECIGHIQKRIGSRLRNVRTKHKETLSDGKRISGRGHLTEKLINKLQNLYGIALRQNVNKTGHEMKVAIGTVLYHSTEFKETENRCLYCPRGTDTWCKCWKDKLNNEKQFVEKPGMPIAVYDIIKPIFLDLSNDTLLKKCLHGKTQNANEALNNLIWTKCPKNVYVEREVLEMGVSSAVINFNNGACGILNVFHGASMEKCFV